MATFTDLKSWFGVPARTGMRVRWSSDPDCGGVIFGDERTVLLVQFDNSDHVSRVHPFAVDYYVDEKWVLGDKLQSAHDALALGWSRQRRDYSAEVE